MIHVKSMLGSLAKITNDFTGITRRKISKISQDRQENLFFSLLRRKLIWESRDFNCQVTDNQQQSLDL